jgi:glutamate 5-kinase
VVTAITPEIEAMAGDAGTELSKGGMKTKVEAGRIALAAGTHMVITTGKPLHPLGRITGGALCTWFLASSDPVTAKKRWIAGQLEPKGAITVDAGAEKALLSGKSLLPAGGGKGGRELGRGLIAYGAVEATMIAGKKSGEIEALLGHTGRAELIHRDDMVVTRGE